MLAEIPSKSKKKKKKDSRVLTSTPGLGTISETKFRLLDSTASR